MEYLAPIQTLSVYLPHVAKIIDSVIKKTKNHELGYSDLQKLSIYIFN